LVLVDLAKLEVLLPWNYSVQLQDPSDAGGSADDSSLVYDLQQAIGMFANYILGIGTLVVDLDIANTEVGRADGGPTSTFLRVSVLPD
jgi:hypothetical protein